MVASRNLEVIIPKVRAENMTSFKLFLSTTEKNKNIKIENHNISISFSDFSNHHLLCSLLSSERNEDDNSLSKTFRPNGKFLFGVYLMVDLVCRTVSEISQHHPKTAVWLLCICSPFQRCYQSTEAIMKIESIKFEGIRIAQ